MGEVRSDIRVEGIVQGVGFRPFVHGLATRLHLRGFVGNDDAGVFVSVEGAEEDVAEFRRLLSAEPPALAVVESVTVTPRRPTGLGEFRIVASAGGGLHRTLVSADAATCADCLRELFDPADRRYRYPFLNCTNCGPRFTIVRDIPYDRPLTTMAGFAMCELCAAEYHDPADRRFHAQPTCCPACGPHLNLLDPAGEPIAGDPLQESAALLQRGAIVAVKGLGGYHLAADATRAGPAATLRARKHREDKPFAIMVAHLAQARELCRIDESAAAALESRQRPIVLLPRRHSDLPAPAVAPGNRELGLMLPYTPLHHLLLHTVGRPLVVTSGNVSDEPIAFRDEEARSRLSGIADAFLTHDRPIHVRTDDSVVRPGRNGPTLLRRARGYAPEPLALHRSCTAPVLACGAELKNTFCLASGRRAFCSQHIGDLENYETLTSFEEGIEHFCSLFGITPTVIAHDLHPEYLSTKYALERTGVHLVPVQHHHAHVASCLLDNGVDGPVIGVAFDGSGYGTDGTIWGGEFLLAGPAGFRRLGHLAPVPLPGGETAIRQPWRMAASYLDSAFGEDLPGGLAVAGRHARQWRQVVTVARQGIGSPPTSSAGRLLDAAAAIIGVRDTTTYEGHAAIALEQCADPAETAGYPAAIEGAETFVVRGTDLIRALVEDLRAGADPARAAARVHNGLAEAVVHGCLRAREVTGLTTVALSGGVFQNVLLSRRVTDRLQAAGFTVLTHSRVPPNDGGISLGQVAVAAAQIR